MDERTPKNKLKIEKMEGFGLRLIEAMEYRKFTQSGLSRATGISQSTICWYRQNKFWPRPDSGQKLAYQLKINYEWLLYGKGEKIFYSGPYPTEQFHTSFPNRLVYLIWTNKLSIKEISSRADVWLVTLQDYVEGIHMPDRKVLKRLCESMDWDFDWLKPESMKPLNGLSPLTVRDEWHKGGNYKFS